jgi:hypothetical protein
LKSELGIHSEKLDGPELRSLQTWRLETRDRRWSSVRFYESGGMILDPLFPKIIPPPAKFWAGA